MNPKSLRIASATVMAAVALGVAVPAASAADTPRAATAQSVAVSTPGLTASQARQMLASPEITAELDANGRAAIQAVADGQATPGVANSAASSAGKAIINLIKKQGPAFFKKAVAAAKKGTGAFNKWVGDLPWYHPVRLAISAGGTDVIEWVMDQLIG
ncbi:hypothetical protein I5Q34_33265 [Streptomyces sp. AV19]|uniref:hypothetical protein n=1 Tax=Streptomyces sp. AV19 TaxID=2793068 RepID=UPI0018FED333|nr:hypothetical protein [Streptomyces sp. AV19]MBH1939074.1 hypothetical protein [Streptomyces sp. AV19]MDG4534275.1 hypothetical protein [Streptomyces sp. AV19]